MFFIVRLFTNKEDLFIMYYLFIYYYLFCSGTQIQSIPIIAVVHQIIYTEPLLVSSNGSLLAWWHRLQNKPTVCSDSCCAFSAGSQQFQGVPRRTRKMRANASDA